MTIYAAASFINFIGSLVLAGGILIYNYKKPLYLKLAMVNIAIAVWAFGYWMWQTSIDYNSALFWTQILTIGSAMIPTGFFIWVTEYLNETKRYRIILILSILSAFVFSTLSFSGHMIVGLRSIAGFSFWPIPGVLYHLFLAFHFVGLMMFGFYRLLANAKNMHGVEHQRLLIVVGGMIFGFVCGLTNFPLWYGINLPPVGNFLIIIYPLTLSYAILRYRFLDIRLIAEEVVLNFIRYALLHIFFIIVVTAYSIYLNEAVNVVGYVFFSGLAAFIITVVGNGVNHSLQNIVTRRLFKIIPAEIRLRRLQSAIAQTVELSQLFDTLQASFKIHMKTESAVLVLSSFNKFTSTPLIFASEDSPNYSDLGKIASVFSNYDDIVLYDELKGIHKDIRRSKDLEIGNEELADILSNNGIYVVVPIPAKNSVNNILCLGAKQHFGVYTTQDISILEGLRLHLSTVLENSLLYEHEKQFNAELQKRVAEATSELRSAYNELKNIDKMKDYIIDITSHELRTPATIVKSYLWLILDGRKGDITPQQKVAIERAYHSNDHLLQLITDMLDIARIEKGKLELNLSEFDLNKTVIEIIEELLPLARDKHIGLNVEDTEDGDLIINGDKDKVTEVVMNLVNNAIKYTKKGYVKVSIKKEDKFAIVNVSDTGVGISEADQARLFTKFFRTEQTLVEVPSAGGTGLGLYITKALLNLMGGSISLESTLNQGTTFTVRIPLSQQVK
ncbi:hypothetical protein KC614_01630 [candidate division WWE3 bacterium]|uniref:histidine kinase n=1 Tax=candidate division WWE3 bacterium TaxID=2053526 RepID=A0A955LKJ2_UNCKA|nr:hypothetical protein [candidate division WWE3 bacterium]